jgi:hypothetical protein
MKGQDKAPRPSHIAGVWVQERPYRKAIYIVTPQQKKEVLEKQALPICIYRDYWTDGLSNRLLLGFLKLLETRLNNLKIKFFSSSS